LTGIKKKAEEKEEDEEGALRQIWAVFDRTAAPSGLE
jgi:hypothetical protein